jgi:hypothetical protein
MKLKEIVDRIYLENDADSGGQIEVDKKMTEKTLEDTFEINDTGLEYVNRELERLNKKAAKLGLKPLGLKILSTKSQKYTDQRLQQERLIRIHTVKIEGESPVIPDYEFIANVEHTEAGNIINIAPNSSVKILPTEYRTAGATCDHCHTKRDRNNTFVLRHKATGEFKRVGRNCLKNFMPDVDPKVLLTYAAALGRALAVLVGGENMEDGGGGGSHSKYYDAASFLYCICAAYYIDGYVSGKKAKQSYEETGKNLMSTAELAKKLMNLHWETTEVQKYYRDKLASVETRAKELAKKIEDWKDEVDWDAEGEKSPQMATYFHNMKVISNSPMIQYKNAGYHASLLGMYLAHERKKAAAEDQKTQSPRTHVGKIGDRIEFEGTLVRSFITNTQFGTNEKYFFEDASRNVIIWWTKEGAIPDAEKGNKYKIRGIVKGQDAWNGIPQTHIKNAKVVPIGPQADVQQAHDQWGNPLDAKGNKIAGAPKAQWAQTQN